MSRKIKFLFLVALLGTRIGHPGLAGTRAETQTLPGTSPLTWEGDLAARMVAGIDRFFMRRLEASVTHRAGHWKRDFSSRVNYVKSIAANRRRLSRLIGVVDPRGPVEMELVTTQSAPSRVGRGPGYRIYAVRWPVFRGTTGEGLLLEPEGEALADVVALPDCEWTPEMLVGLVPGVPSEGQFARRLAENGLRVLVPTLIDRGHLYSGIPSFRMTDQPHREFIYRPAYQMGRTMIGYEVQKVLAGVDWFEQEGQGKRPIGVIGYGEGGLLAFYSAAVDPRIDAVAVSGYFQPREQLWQEPIDRNVWGLLEEFGDAEIAGLIAPRPLVIEAGRYPELIIPLQQPGKNQAAPAQLGAPPASAVEGEVRRAQDWVKGLTPPTVIRLIQTGDTPPGNQETLAAFLQGLGLRPRLSPLGKLPQPLKAFNPQARLKRQFDQLQEDIQFLVREGEFRRAEFWSQADASSVEGWAESSLWYRDYFWDEIIGRLPPASVPVRPRTRLIYDEPKYRGYEVVLDVYPDVFSYGILLVPKDIRPNERRPVVVCQHGLEGRPQDVANPKVDDHHYRQFADRLTERGFVTFSPQNPYIGWDKFRVLIRKSHPIKKSLYAVIVRQHERILEWLAAQPFVDPDRIGFYGLSYGGKTAMRIPALLDRYSLSICSADFNEWIWKNTSIRHKYSYLLVHEYDMMEFNLGNTFNYAEMSWLIFPRPFMVERGHHDGVAPDEWVAYEYAKSRRHYNLLGLGHRTEIEFFNGPHAIHGVGTFEFLHRHLRWKRPE